MANRSPRLAMHVLRTPKMIEMIDFTIKLMDYIPICAEKWRGFRLNTLLILLHKSQSQSLPPRSLQIPRRLEAVRSRRDHGRLRLQCVNRVHLVAPKYSFFKGRVFIFCLKNLHLCIIKTHRRSIKRLSSPVQREVNLQAISVSAPLRWWILH